MGDQRRTEGLDPAVPGQLFVRKFQLESLAGRSKGSVYTSAGERVVIGSHQSTDLVCDDPTVSGFHCEITVVGGRAIVRDLGSRNGTMVDDTSVVVAYLKDGAVLTLGRTKLRFALSTESVRVPMSSGTSFGRMVGQSRVMRSVFALLERAAQNDMTVLLMGETGTGKDLAAESIHRESRRGTGAFLVVDCSAIPSGLLESELFGHERGAFTGAERAKEGVFEAASGGTVFLDEIGELSLDLQPKLLRTLETREIQRVGSTKRTPIDVRLMAATNRNLRAEVNARRFRPDLYYRLAVLEVTLPPLRERAEDLPLMVAHLLEAIDAPPAALERIRSSDFLASLARHPWPGNVRELRNYIERCVAFGEDRPFEADTSDRDSLLADVDQPLRIARDRLIRRFERQYLEELLRRHDDNVSAAARAAGVDRVYFHRLLARYGLR